MRAQIERARVDYAAAEARRRTPEARAERVESRTIHHGLGRDGALALARRELTEVFGHAAFKPIDLPGGAKVERFAGATGALIETDGDTQLVESSGMPLTSTVGSGERDFVDLGLRPSGAGFAPRNPVVALHINARGSARLPDDETTIAVEGLEVADEAIEADGRVFLGGALPDTDVVVAPDPGGVSYAFQVRSAGAPETAALSFSLPEGATLRLGTGENAGAAEVVGADGEVRGRVLAPSAWDADGKRFDVDYAVDASRLVVRYPHRDSDLRYPLYVDPIYHDDGYFPQSNGWIEWTHHTQGGSWDNSIGNPMYVRNRAGGYWYDANQWGAYALRSLRGYVSKVEGSYVSHNNQVTCAYMGILVSGWSSWKSAWSPSNCAAVTNAFPVVTNSNPSYDDWVMFQYKMTVGGKRWYVGGITASGARIWLDDNERPTIAGVTNSSGGAWLPENQQVTINPSAYDQGLGVRVFNFYGAGNPVSWIRGNTVPTTDSSQACTGVRGGRCPQSTVTGAITVNTNNLTEGNITYTGEAFDALNKGTTYSTSIKVDRSPPVLSLTGPLVDAGGGTIRGGYYPAASPWTRRAIASDSHSGVRNVDVLLDGRSVLGGAANSSTRDWTFHPGTCIFGGGWTSPCAKYGSGTHHVRVVATDNVGHSMTRDFMVTWLP
jgi:hypothetical protein